MPIYEFTCQGCGRTFETLVRGGAEPQCPHCQSTHLDKQLSVFATTAGAAPPAPMMAGPCGACGHPDGPGACRLQ